MNKKAVLTLKWAGIAILLVAVSYSINLAFSTAALRKAYEAVEAEGFPTKLENIIPAAIPDQDNAALIYEAVALQLKSHDIKNSPLSITDTPATDLPDQVEFTPTEWDAFIKSRGDETALNTLSYLAQKITSGESTQAEVAAFNKSIRTESVFNALNMLHQATRKPGCRFNLNYNKGVDMILPHLSELRSLSRILSARAQLSSEKGDNAAAWQDFRSELAIVRALESEPLLISQLVRVALLSPSLNTFKQLAAKSPIPTETKADIQKTMTGINNSSYFEIATHGERLLFGEALFNMPMDELVRVLGGMDDQTRLFAPIVATWFRPSFQRDHAAYLTIMLMHAKSAQALGGSGMIPPPLQPDKDLYRDHSLTDMAAPALEHSIDHFTTCIAQARMTLTVLDLEEFRAEKGHYPESLSSLNHDLHIDPFSGKPFVYKKSASGFTLYSFGQNRTDDGGNSSDIDTEGDIVW